MITILENEKIKVAINSKGAELSSLFLKSENIEYIWQANPEIWGRHAPVLFPIVGRLKNNTYKYNNETYHLSQHGFARDMEFEIVSCSENNVVYKLEGNKETIRVYPFSFELFIEYEISESLLNVKYSVKNQDNKEMYFSIGAHPGFNCPLKRDEFFEDYYIEFEVKENAGTYLVESGYISENKIPLLMDEKIIDLSKDLFANDTIILEDLKSGRLSIKSKKSKHKIVFNFAGFKYLGIWSKQEGVPFICIEPWNGIGDGLNTSGELIEKKGILSLIPGKEFNCNYSISIE